MCSSVLDDATLWSVCVSLQWSASPAALTFHTQCTNVGKMMVVHVCVHPEQPAENRLDGCLEICRERYACRVQSVSVEFCHAVCSPRVLTDFAGEDSLIIKHTLRPTH